MTGFRKHAGLILLVLSSAACAGPPAAGGTPGAQDRQLFAGRLPPLEGDSLRTTMVEVTYGPGGSSSPHRHPCPVLGYVLEGAVRMRMEGGADTILRAGQTFYEPPMREHLISANASRRMPARFLAIFTCDATGPLSIRPGAEPVEGKDTP